ncbi:hypothetical protein [Parasitella parasitica]|uniref:Uncharacterized protein n=1 Tax=Parasitella parasitica TaxID=35722 RepID=A0A0B7N6X1_9FUNG|nr:hypothetical protein [Parasitella parasitica]
MNSQPIQYRQPAMNSFTSQNTGKESVFIYVNSNVARILIFGLATMELANNNSDNKARDPPSSDEDLFGDDEELLQALEAGGATWAAISGVQQAQDDNRHVDSIVETTGVNQSQVSKTADVGDPKSNASSVTDAMSISDHYDELPDSPDFSWDELPIFTRRRRLIPISSLIEATPSQPAATIDPLKRMQGDNEHLQIQHNELGMLDPDSRLDWPTLNDSNEAVVDYNQFTQKMNMLDLADKASSTTADNVVPSPTNKTENIETAARSLRKRRAIQLRPFSVEQARFKRFINRHNTKAKIKDAVPQQVADSQDTEFTVSSPQLRKRNAIQLRPFSVEQARLQRLINKSSMKGKITATVPKQVDDPQDTEFTLSNPQLVDDPTDKIQTSQMNSETTAVIKKKSTNKRTPLPSKVKICSRNRTITTESRADMVAVIDDTITNAHLEECFDCFYPIQDVLSNTTNSSSKPEMITFEKKRRSRKGKSPVRGGFSPPSSASASKKGLFKLDALPRSTFDFATSSSNASSIAVSGQDSYVAQQKLQEMNEEAAFNDSDYSMIKEKKDDKKADVEETEEMDVDSEEIVKRRYKMKKLAIFDSSDDEDQEIVHDNKEEQAPVKQEPHIATEAELDAIFEFPGAGPSSTIKPARKRLVRSPSEDDIVPVVPDRLEYREHKRQRFDIQDVLKKKKTLKSILPASFRKVYQKELVEEDKLRKTPKKLTKNATTSTTTTTTTTTIATAKQTKCSDNKPLADVFAAFLGSQSEDDSDEDPDDLQDAYYTLNDYVTRLDYPTPIPAQGNSGFGGSATTTNGLLDFFGETVKQARLNSSTNLSSIRTTKLQPHPTHGAVYPIEEASEYNRIARQYHGSSNSEQPTRTIEKSTAKAPRSSITIKPPPKSLKKPPIIATRDNAAPTKKRRKKVKRARDDIYVHAPSSYRACNDESGQAPDNDGRIKEREDTPSRMAFDDIYVGTRQYVRYATELLSAKRFNETINYKPVRIIYSLHQVISRVQHLHDYDLRRIAGLKDTVYLHHRLLTPLLSSEPDRKSAYKHLIGNYSPYLDLFDRHMLWKNITPKHQNLIAHLFYKVSADIEKILKLDFPDEDTELPGHDYFYTFVSICLTQWIPLHSYDDRIQLTEMFMRHIRYLGRLVPQLVDKRKEINLSWRPVVKLMVYILDWSCRLHHLGVHPIHWSVKQSTQGLIDILVFIGFDDIKPCSKEYLSEAWICLLQIMSVSSKARGFYFSKQTFVEQMTSSIKTKSRSSGVYEYEKRRTTRLWAESLDFIIEKYMMK